MDGLRVLSHDAVLEEGELSALRKLTALCREHGLLERPPGLRDDDTIYGLNDETTRYIRGCALDTDRALRQFKEAQAIRHSIDANKAYDIVDVEEFEAARKMFPHWTGRRDKLGMPVLLFDLAHINDGVVAKYNEFRGRTSQNGTKTVSEATEKLITFHDYLTRFVTPLCAAARDRPHPDSTVTGAVYLADISSVTIKQGWGLRGFIQDINRVLAICYPEVVHRAFLVNAPPYFETVWGMVKKWFDPRTAQKIVIVSPADVLATLSAAIDIEDIPAQFGGGCAFTHGMAPVLDDELKKTLGVNLPAANEIPRGPLKWTLGANGDRRLVAVGTESGTQRNLVLDEALQVAA